MQGPVSQRTSNHTMSPLKKRIKRGCYSCSIKAGHATCAFTATNLHIPSIFKPFVKFNINGDTTAKCTFCAVDCNSVESILEHITSKRHRRKIQSVLCSSCNFEFQGLRTAFLNSKTKVSKVHLDPKMSKSQKKVEVKSLYINSNASNYARRSDIRKTQQEMTIRAFQLLHLPSLKQSLCHVSESKPLSKNNHIPLIIDLGSGSGMSSTVARNYGCMVIGCDISQHMLLEQSTENALADGRHSVDTPLNCKSKSTTYYPSSELSSSGLPSASIQNDFGDGLPFRDGVFDAAISVSALQWLVTKSHAQNSKTSKGIKTKNCETHPKRIRAKWLRLCRFFRALRKCLKGPGSRAILQIYFESRLQARLMCEAAWYAGAFVGGLICDFPHVKKRKKWYLCLQISRSTLAPIRMKLEYSKNCSARSIGELQCTFDQFSKHEFNTYDDSDPACVRQAQKCIEETGRSWHSHWSTNGLRAQKDCAYHINNNVPSLCPLALRFHGICALQWYTHLHLSQSDDDQHDCPLHIPQKQIDRLQNFHCESARHLLRFVRFKNKTENKKGMCINKSKIRSLRPHDQALQRAVLGCFHHLNSHLRTNNNHSMNISTKQKIYSLHPAVKTNEEESIFTGQIPNRLQFKACAKKIVHAMHDSVQTFYYTREKDTTLEKQNDNSLPC